MRVSACNLQLHLKQLLGKYRSKIMDVPTMNNAKVRLKRAEKRIESHQQMARGTFF